jgi:hypothetical protein
MRSLKALIGTDCAERIQVTSRWEAWLDEDGATAGKPVNQAATLIAQSFGFEFSLLGPVVIVGVDKDTAEPAALSPAQAGAILEKIAARSRQFRCAACGRWPITWLVDQTTYSPVPEDGSRRELRGGFDADAEAYVP